MLGKEGSSKAVPFRLLLNVDPGVPQFFFPNRPCRDDLEHFIDCLAIGPIDAFAYCIFEGGHPLIRNSEYFEPHPTYIGGNLDTVRSGGTQPTGKPGKGIWPAYPFPNCRGYKPIYEAGEDPIQIYAERCHKHGMKLLACFRMNDRHPGRKGRFQEEHPEWQIREPGCEGPYWKGAIDYSFPEVRQWVLGLIRDVAQGYDVDGVELDYARWWHMFPPTVARERHPLLTDFMQKAREILNEAGRTKNSRILLGARVPQRLGDAAAVGYDVAAWVEGGMVDYLCPTDFHFPDFNAPYEDFVRLARGTDCGIYPSIHPVIAGGINGALLTRAQYRALAQRFYAAGADGISLYNFQYHWQQQISLGYPGLASNFLDIVRFVGELRDPANVSQGTRHYVFYPLWADAPPTGVEGVEGIHRMTLIERGEIGQRKVFTFRLGERDGVGHPRWQLLFNAVNLTDKDEIDIDLNGVRVAPAGIQRKHSPKGLKVDYRRPLGPYSMVRFFLGGLPLKQGVNELGIRLMQSDHGAEGRIEVQEVEVIIEPV